MFDIFNNFSDFINRILVSQFKNFNFVFLNFSIFNLSILKILKFEGYIDNIFVFFFSYYNLIIVKLKYYSNKIPAIRIFKRISKSKLKIYRSYKNLPILMNGLGCIILSTSKGIFSDKYCKTHGIGGEIICYVF